MRLDFVAEAILLAALAALLTVLTIRLARRFNFGADRFTGIQRAHRHWVPRLGGAPIFIAFLVWVLVTGVLGGSEAEIWALCLAPAFAAGLAEDLTHKVGAWPRLLLTMASAGLAWLLLDVRVDRLGPDVLDLMLDARPALSLAVTLLFVGGAAHAVNIIDGYNGLASSYAMAVLIAVLIVALRVGDSQIAVLTTGVLAAAFGFFVLNFPYGRIFLGDGGSYLLGTLIAFLLVLLTRRHAQVSPMFAAMLLVYPVWETLFSMYRRRVRGTPSMVPDAAHLHTLVHKRLVRSNRSQHSELARVLMNSATTIYALVLTTITSIVAVLLWQNSLALLAAFFGFIGIYMSLYQALVRFRTPRSLSVRDRWVA